MSVTIQYFYKTKFFLTFLITAICFVFTYYYFHFFYVEYEGLFDSFYSGSLTEGMPFRSIYFLGNIGTSHLYSLLYQINPKVEWISWILYSYLFVSCFVGLYIVIELLPDQLPVWIKLLIQAGIYMLVFADHNIHFIFTRVSYMAVGLSLIGMVYFFSSPGSIRNRPWLFVLFNFGFVIGTLTRSESATAAFLQIAFFGIYYLRHIKRFATLFLFPFLFLISVLGAIAYDLKTSTEFYKQVEPEIEAQFCERQNIVPLANMKTERDSAMWKAAKNILWSDPKIVTPQYMRSLVRPEKFIYTDIYQWKRVYRNISAITLRFWYLALLVVLLGLLLLVYNKSSSLLLWLIFVGSFWLLIAIQTYTVKVNDRSFAPLMSLFIFCHIIILIPHFKTKTSKWLYPMIAGGLVFLGIHIYYLKAEANQLQYDLEEYQRNTKAITKLAVGKYLVVNSSSCDYLFSGNKPFHPFNFPSFKKVYITEGFNIPFLPYYRRYLEKECNCSMLDFPAFWDYLRTKHEEVVIVSTTERMNILCKYLTVVHGYNLPVTETTSTQLPQLQKSDARGIFANLKIYSLGK